MKICQHAAKIFNKTGSFEVTIGLLPLHFNHLITRIPVTEVLQKSVNMELRYLTKQAVLHLI